MNGISYIHLDEFELGFDGLTDVYFGMPVCDPFYGHGKLPKIFYLSGLH